MNTDLDKQLQDAKKKLEQVQADHDAAKQYVTELMRGVEAEDPLVERLLRAEQIFKSLEACEVLRYLRLLYFRR